MEIKDLIKQAHQTAVEHGWWENERNFGEQIALMHSELSETLEEYRNHKRMTEIYYECKQKGQQCNYCKDGICQCICKEDPFPCSYAKPCGIPTELADCIIRIADTCGKYGIDLDQVLKIKMDFNKIRPYKHGGKKA